MLEEQIFIIVMVILLVTIVGGGVSAWFKFTESIESDVEYRAAAKVAHRLAGSSQCLTYISEGQRASKDVLDANKLRLASEAYGMGLFKNLVFLSPLMAAAGANGVLSREHPCAFLMGYRWQAHVVDLEFFPDLERKERERLAERSGCLLAERSCVWDMGKPFHYTPRLEQLEAKEAARASDSSFCSGSDACVNMKGRLEECLSKGDDALKGLSNPTPPVRVPVAIAATNDIGQLERHLGYLEVVVIPSERHCTRDEYGARALTMAENSAVIGKTCCIYDLQEGVCLGNLKLKGALEGKLMRTVYIFSGVGALTNLLTGYCPEFGGSVGPDTIACKCVDKGQPVEVIGVDGPRVAGTGCPRQAFFAAKVQNRNWEEKAAVKAIKLAASGEDYLPCTRESCRLADGAIWVAPPKELGPRAVGTYVFAVPGDRLEKRDEAKVRVTVEYTIPKIPSPYEKPKGCEDAGGLYVCSHSLEATFPASVCVGEEPKGACMGRVCSPEQVCCSAGGCIPKERRNHCEAAVAGWDVVKRTGDELAGAPAKK